MANNEPNSDLPNLRVMLELDRNLTWSELFAFVDAARRDGVDPADTVAIDGVAPVDEVRIWFFTSPEAISPEPGTLIQ